MKTLCQIKACVNNNNDTCTLILIKNNAMVYKRCISMYKHALIYKEKSISIFFVCVKLKENQILNTKITKIVKLFHVYVFFCVFSPSLKIITALFDERFVQSI